VIAALRVPMTAIGGDRYFKLLQNGPEGLLKPVWNSTLPHMTIASEGASL
jgi:hypothetical protein